MGSSGRSSVDVAFDPVDHGFLAWTEDPQGVPASTALATAGTLYLRRIRLPAPALVSNIHIYLATAGSTLTAGQCFAALFSAAGARLSPTADQAAAWGSSGAKTMALTAAQQLAAGDYYVGFWFNGTTGPALTRSTNTAGGFTNVGQSAGSYRSATADTGLTTTAPATFGAQIAFAHAWWVALS